LPDLRSKVSHIGPTDQAPEWKKNEWRRKAAWLGKNGESKKQTPPQEILRRRSFTTGAMPEAILH
jgi:hypothetical protein